MKNNHVQRGLLFVGICIVLGVGLAMAVTLSHRRPAVASSQAATENAALPTYANATSQNKDGDGGTGAELPLANVDDVSKAQSEQSPFEESDAALASAQNSNVSAVSSIGLKWKSLPAKLRKELLPGQRAWIKQKDIYCRSESIATSLGPVLTEVKRLECENQETTDRIGWLQNASQTPIEASNALNLDTD